MLHKINNQIIQNVAMHTLLFRVIIKINESSARGSSITENTGIIRYHGYLLRV